MMMDGPVDTNRAAISFGWNRSPPAAILDPRILPQPGGPWRRLDWHRKYSRASFNESCKADAKMGPANVDYHVSGFDFCGEGKSNEFKQFAASHAKEISAH